LAPCQPEHDEISTRPRRAFSPLALVLAASLLLAVTVALFSQRGISRSELEALRRAEAARAQEMERLRAELSRANDLIGQSRLHFASLRESGPDPALRGYVVWDRQSRQIHFYAFDLPPLDADRVYRVWLAAEGRPPVASGTLLPDATRAGSMLIDVPADLGDKFRVVVVPGPLVAESSPAAEPWLTSKVE
jgi:hypothetical protein